MSDEVRETVNENQKLSAQEEQITKPAPKVKPQKEKDPKKVAAGKKLAEKNRQAKAALEREIKREIAEKEQQDENSAGWLPEMSFQTVLSIVGVAFSAFELYKRFHPKSSSPREEPKQSDRDRESGDRESGVAAAGAKLRAPSSEAPSKTLRKVEEGRSEQRADERNPVSSKIGMV